MSAKHTPGPWHVKSDPFHFDTLSSIVGGEKRGDGKRFPSHELNAEVGGFADFEIQEANARLIAAAPDLLEALEEAEKCLAESEYSEDGYARKLVRAAIAKAKGESNEA